MRFGWLLLLAAVPPACGGSNGGTAVSLPAGSTGIGFDDLRYAPTLHRLLVPAGRSGRLDLINPDDSAVDSIAGFDASEAYSGGHDDGPTSADEGRGFVFVTDRTSQSVAVVDPAKGKLVASFQLVSTPDYVRYVGATDEIWVSEPDASQIEILALSQSDPPTPSHVGSIPVDNGPESLVIDQTHGLAYTHRWQSSSVVVDVRSRQVVAEWPNGCAASRGLAIDDARGFFIVACNEGTVSVLDLNHGGRILSSLAKGSGFDVIGYAPLTGHVVLAGTACGCAVILGVGSDGGLQFLGRFDAPSGAHCAAADDRGHAWVCAPDAGNIRRIDDGFAATL